MAAVIQWLVKAMQFGGPAAIGYFFNDLAEGIGKILPGEWKENKTGGYSITFVVLVVLLGGAALYLVLQLVAGLAGKKGARILAFSWIGLAGWIVYFAFPGLFLYEDVITAELLGSIAAATTGTIRSQFCPEFITFVRAATPTSFVINVTGDGEIFNLDAAGLDNMNGQRVQGALQANGFIFQIANGYVEKTTTFTIANAAGAQLDVYGFSTAPGTWYNVHAQAQALAGQSLPLDDFFYLAFPNAAVGDRWTLTFADGTTTQITDRLELENYLAYMQEVTATRFNLDNYEQALSEVQFVGVLTQSIYWASQREARGVIDQGII